MINNQVKAITDNNQSQSVVQNDVTKSNVVDTKSMNQQQVQQIAANNYQQNQTAWNQYDQSAVNYRKDLQSVASNQKQNDASSCKQDATMVQNASKEDDNVQKRSNDATVNNNNYVSVNNDANVNHVQINYGTAQVTNSHHNVPYNTLNQSRVNVNQNKTQQSAVNASNLHQNQLKVEPRDSQNNITFGSCNDLNQVVVDLKNPISGNLNSQVQFNNGGGVKLVSANGNQLTITTNSDIDFQKTMTVTVDGQQYTIDPTNGTAMAVTRSQAFCNKYVYNGDDLGATYTKNATTFKVYAPTASMISLNLFANDTDPNAALKSWQHMTFDPNTGVWTVTVQGDLNNTAYDYLVQFANGKSHETYDSYATACVKGGFRSVVLSPEEMGSNVTAGKVTDQDDPTNEVIGEIDVRDFTNDPSSGVTSNVRGTYVGAVQSVDTTDSNGNPTGINYLKHVGINTVQIQPMFQYDDDGNNTNSTYQYDWGYDPENYNIPEGWYSTNRDDPATRIKECKQMIQAFHDNGIRVNMDVVYNHVANHGTNALALTVPGYYFRYGNNGQLTNASACGNDIASERPMMRNYIVHSCEYWHNVYGVDGFRFDLMGNLDIGTLQAVRKALPNCVIYGEGWNMGANIPDSDKADQANEKQMPTIGTFNGWGRTVMRGSDDGKQHGYIEGQTGQQQMSQLANFIWGCQNLPNTPSNAIDGGVNYDNPNQVINYAECHDNKTLYDTIRAAYPNENPDVSMRRAELANSITILNEGVPYVQVGQGFGRSKNGDGNSYRSGDAVNNIHWNTQDKRTWATSYEKALIDLRNSDPAFRMTSYADMDKNMKWVEINDNNGVIGYQLTSLETGKTYIIAYSNNASGQQLTGLANGKYKVLIKNCNGYVNDPQEITVTNGTTDIPSLSCLVLEVDNSSNHPATKPSTSDTNHNNNGNSSSPNKPSGSTSSGSAHNEPVSGNSGSSSSQTNGNQPQSGSSNNQPNSGDSSSSMTDNHPSKPNNGSSSSQDSNKQPTIGSQSGTNSDNGGSSSSSTTDKPVVKPSTSGSDSNTPDVTKPSNSQPNTGNSSSSSNKPVNGGSSTGTDSGTTKPTDSTSSTGKPASGITSNNDEKPNSSNSSTNVPSHSQKPVDNSNDGNHDQTGSLIEPSVSDDGHKPVAGNDTNSIKPTTNDKPTSMTKPSDNNSQSSGPDVADQGSSSASHTGSDVASNGNNTDNSGSDATNSDRQSTNSVSSSSSNVMTNSGSQTNTNDESKQQTIATNRSNSSDNSSLVDDNDANYVANQQQNSDSSLLNGSNLNQLGSIKHTISSKSIKMTQSAGDNNAEKGVNNDIPMMKNDASRTNDDLGMNQVSNKLQQNDNNQVTIQGSKMQQNATLPQTGSTDADVEMLMMLGMGMIGLAGMTMMLQNKDK